MTEDQLVNKMIALLDDGASPDDLLESTVSVEQEDLYGDAVAAFGSWDAYLASVLVHLRAVDRAESSPSSRELVDIERPPRDPGRSVGFSVCVLALDGCVFSLGLDAIRATAEPELRQFPTGPGGARPERIVPCGVDTGLVLLSDVGNAVTVDRRVLQDWGEHALVHRPGERFDGLESGERIADVVLRRAFREYDRFYSVSTQGQVKATDCSDFGRLSATALQAFLLRDEDRFVCAFCADERTTLYVASSFGKAIAFDASEIRSQGRRATGVRGIALDPDAEVVGAFPVEEGRAIALATDTGYLKRMPFEEFRTQGRAGGGLQTYRLGSGEHVVAVGSVPLDGDVLVLTSEGRYARFPAYDLPFEERAGRGETLLELGPSEQIAQIVGVPPGEL